ncbi:MAG: hypothetical protein HY761_05250 [Candidatus Omnitrophica bacterium]|nr:hypothetical protein [Candidatus Omnitrophota bacterium]
MFTQQKNEKGMALIVAIFVTVFLLFISMAFFTSSRNTVNYSRQNWAGLVSLEVAEGGAERAVWYVQKMLDSNPEWKPGTSTDTVLLPGMGDYDKFVKNYRNKQYEYADYGIKLIHEDNRVDAPNEYQASQIYAAKMMKRDDPNTEVEEWLVCSAGATRFALSDKGSAKEIKGVDILVRLGRNVKGNPEVSVLHIGKRPGGLPGDNNVKMDISRYLHISGMENGVSKPAKIYTEQNFQYVSNDGNPDPGERGSRIGWSPNSDIIMEKATGVTTTSMSGDPTWNSLIANDKLKMKDNVQRDFLDLDFDTLTKGKNNGSTADYTAEELVASGAWEDKGTYYQPKYENMYLAGAASPVNSATASGRCGGRVVYKDGAKGAPDGSVIIYIPPGKGFRHGGVTYSEKIYVENGVHGIIVSEGAFTSTGNAVYGNSQDAISNVGVDIRAEIHSVGGTKLDQGILPGGNQTLADYKLGITLPDMAEGGEYNVYGAYGAVGELLGYIVQDKHGNTVSPPGWGEPLWSDNVGVLDILSSNNVILSNQYGDKEEGVSRFRGFISSKKQVLIQGDFAIRGAIGGKEGVAWSNQWGYTGDKTNDNNTYKGYDSVLMQEDPLNRGGAATNSIIKPAYGGAGGSKADHRTIEILAWNMAGNTKK